MLNIPSRIEAVNRTIEEMTATIRTLADREGWCVAKEAAQIGIQVANLGRVVEKLAMTLEIEVDGQNGTSQKS